MSRTPPAPAVLVACAVLVSACGDDPMMPEPEVRPWQLDLSASEFEMNTQFGRDCRLVNILENEPVPIVPGWTATIDMVVERRALVDGRFIAVEDVVAVDFHLDEPVPGAYHLLLRGAVSDTLVGSAEGDGYRGSWQCGPSFPLSDDQALIEAGYDASEPIEGSWTLGPIPPTGTIPNN